MIIVACCWCARGEMNTKDLGGVDCIMRAQAAVDLVCLQPRHSIMYLTLVDFVSILVDEYLRLKLDACEGSVSETKKKTFLVN